MGKVRRKEKRKGKNKEKKGKKKRFGAVRDTRERKKRPTVILKISGLPAVETGRSKRKSWSTRGYRNPNFSSKFQKVGVSPTLVIFFLMAILAQL